MKKQIIRFCPNKLVIILLLAILYLPAIAKDESGNSIKREFKIKKGQNYLNLPVNSSAPLVRATVFVAQEPLDRFTINLAYEEPEFWTFIDVSSYQGKIITIEVENAPSMFSWLNTQDGDKKQNKSLEPARLGLIFTDSEFPGQDSVYKEKGRPQIHFTPQRGWMNDPNGLIYYGGEYHMYFQHNPFGWEWGNMHWGHAVSNDLIHWKQLPEAIYPYLDKNGEGKYDAAFSGSAVTDPANTSGFRKDGIDPLIAVYTSTGRGECLKMSYDNGRTFIDYEGNPILEHNGRDPKVFWYDEGQHWVMVVWDAGITKKIGLGQEISLRQHSIYTSPNLKDWTYQSGVTGFFECPELFKLPVEGKNGIYKWIMYDAHGRYVVGDFDGKNFTIEQHFTKYVYGGGYFYASQTFNNVPDGRRIQVGWGRNITNPGMPFNQPQLIPTELKLKQTLNGYRLCPTPIKEISALQEEAQLIENKVIESGMSDSLLVDTNSPLHIVALFERGDAPISLNILGYELTYDNEWIFEITAPVTETEVKVSAGPFTPPESFVPPITYIAENSLFKIEAFIDKNILEIFVNDGELYYVSEFLGEKSNVVKTFVKGRGKMSRGAKQKIILKKLEVSELRSIWD